MSTGDLTITIKALQRNASGVRECYPCFKKWEIISFGNNSTAIVIRIKINQAYVLPPFVPSHTYTVYPYKQHKYKLFHWLWFKFLKLRVWIGDFYKT